MSLSTVRNKSMNCKIDFGSIIFNVETQHGVALNHALTEWATHESQLLLDRNNKRTLYSPLIFVIKKEKKKQFTVINLPSPLKCLRRSECIFF